MQAARQEYGGQAEIALNGGGRFLASAIADPVVPRPHGLQILPRESTESIIGPPPTPGYVLQMSADNHTGGHGGGVLCGAGIVISPAVGALLMSASTVIAAINARLLKLKKEDQDDER
jgi:hypothetical protein